MKTVFVDVDTQLDFMMPSGALSVPGAAALIPAIARLNQFAAAHGIPILSTVDAHTENDPEFRVWPPHCIAGTLGQRKVSATLLPDYAGQRVFEKQLVDFGPTDAFQAEVASLEAGRFVVYGVVTEYCVKSAALALLKAGNQVELVTDAIQGINTEQAVLVLRDLQAAGATLTTLAAVS